MIYVGLNFENFKLSIASLHGFNCEVARHLTSPMRLNLAKCKIMHVCKKNLRPMYHMKDGLHEKMLNLTKTDLERYLGVYIS